MFTYFSVEVGIFAFLIMFFCISRIYIIHGPCFLYNTCLSIILNSHFQEDIVIQKFSFNIFLPRFIWCVFQNKFPPVHTLWLSPFNLAPWCQPFKRHLPFRHFLLIESKSLSSQSTQYEAKTFSWVMSGYSEDHKVIKSLPKIWQHRQWQDDNGRWVDFDKYFSFRSHWLEF